ncbi:5-deoxy-glucuronate isomerase [Phycicoccus sp. SLBN-51]|uniref:5-deoxy-glucuronate isomerase n=1 Tax=Phycicoccus sp. SLBN-51 TaxID=2768447 RepID=UPI00115266A1|nr:5-deoxy-glucuronate isomerase [Phycicoccus sp. SLBN-51]TQJ48809.1 5-deoxyglucuronate isomerase [Phycicoccus sp. SLBN-51]
MSRSGADNERWVRPSGSTRQDGWDVAIDDDIEGWQHTSLYAARLAEGESREVPAGEWEHVVVPLSGSVTVECVHGKAVLVGRPSVFAGPTDIAYVARDTALTVTATGGPARVAVCGAQAAAPHTPSFRHVEAAEVPVELRGAGTASREVRNFGIPGVLDADSLIACEVVTPAGNWSSYPPHKHDEEREGVETELEEIYYFETQVEVGAPAPAGADPVGYQRVYGTDDRPIDVVAEVRTGDVVLVPHGWHGPAMAPPGYDLYYLNVMAGPGDQRAWLICDDPAHGWVRQTWTTQDVDPRLPLGGQ